MTLDWLQVLRQIVQYLVVQMKKSAVNIGYTSTVSKGRKQEIKQIHVAARDKPTQINTYNEK